MSISIGIPFYNAEKFLAEAIRSVFAQTYQDWELILIDDGSTDGSLEIARSVNDKRVRVISDGVNKKLAMRLNQIVTEAKHDIIARMDADDLISPSKLEKQMAVLDKYPEIDLVSTGMFSITNKLQPIGVRWHHSDTITFKELLARKGCCVVHAAILGRKSWFIRNPYDSTIKIAQDYELWLRSCSNNDFNIHLLQEPLYYYREQSSVTAKKMQAAYRNDRKVIWQYARLKGLPYIMKSYYKSLIVQVLSPVGQMDFLLKRRSEPINNNKLLEKYNIALQQISRTIVPGLG